MKKNFLAKRILFSCILSGGIAAPAYTAEYVEGNVEFYGVLIAPPSCTIDDGGQVNVDFGDHIGIKSVDGVNHRKEMNYQIVCGESKVDNWALTLTLTGDTAEFDKRTALRTDKANLGIQVYQNGRLFVPGSSLSITLDNQPKLEAVPVKKIGSVLTDGGKFEAWATLKAEYQ